jgi:hypothetical protein
VNRAEARQSEGGLLLLYHFNVEMATAQFHFDTPTACGGELHYFLYDNICNSNSPMLFKYVDIGLVWYFLKD